MTGPETPSDTTCVRHQPAVESVYCHALKQAHGGRDSRVGRHDSTGLPSALLVPIGLPMMHDPDRRWLSRRYGKLRLKPSVSYTRRAQRAVYRHAFLSDNGSVRINQLDVDVARFEEPSHVAGQANRVLVLTVGMNISIVTPIRRNPFKPYHAPLDQVHALWGTAWPTYGEDHPRIHQAKTDSNRPAHSLHPIIRQAQDFGHRIATPSLQGIRGCARRLPCRPTSEIGISAYVYGLGFSLP